MHLVDEMIASECALLATYLPHLMTYINMLAHNEVVILKQKTSKKTTVG